MDFLRKNSAVSCHFLLQGILPTQGSNRGIKPKDQSPTWQANSLPLSHLGRPYLGRFLQSCSKIIANLNCFNVLYYFYFSFSHNENLTLNLFSIAFFSGLYNGVYLNLQFLYCIHGNFCSCQQKLQIRKVNVLMFILLSDCFTYQAILKSKKISIF